MQAFTSKQQQCYFNRKQYHSIVNQVVCDGDRRIVDVVTNIAGAVHDVHIWASCNLQHLIEQQRILQGPVYMYGAHAIPQISSVACIGCCFCFTAQTLISFAFLYKLHMLHIRSTSCSPMQMIGGDLAYPSTRYSSLHDRCTQAKGSRHARRSSQERALQQVPSKCQDLGWTDNRIS